MCNRCLILNDHTHARDKNGQQPLPDLSQKKKKKKSASDWDGCAPWWWTHWIGVQTRHWLGCFGCLRHSTRSLHRRHKGATFTLLVNKAAVAAAAAGRHNTSHWNDRLAHKLTETSHFLTFCLRFVFVPVRHILLWNNIASVRTI